MSTKRTSAESGNDDQKNEASDPLFQQEDYAECAKLSPLSDTTLQDLPIELLEHILIKVVIMEVKAMKLAKCVWKEKAELVISRLRTVCSQWNSFLETDFFRNELHRTIDSTAHETIRLEILYRSPVKQVICGVAALKDEIFVLCSSLDQDAVINVYDRSNISEIKDVISLPGRTPMYIAACKVSNCLYVSLWSSPLALRITKDEEHQFNISTWINEQMMPNVIISVSANGSLLLFSEKEKEAPAVVSVYKPNASGSLQHEIILSTDIDEHIFVVDVIQKSNGNLVLIVSDHDTRKLIEIDARANAVRIYQSSLSVDSGVNIADIHDRIMITDEHMGMELLDSEFNLLDFSSPLKDEGQLRNNYLRYNTYDNERNEVMCISGDHSGNEFLTIFRFTEE